MERNAFLTTRIVDLLQQCNIPENFVSSSQEKDCCIFVISCSTPDRLPSHGASPESIMGYSLDEFQKGGMKFWFSLIHPEDLPLVSGKIIEAHETLHTCSSGAPAAIPLVLKYRIRHPRGKYVWLRDSRFLLSHNGEGMIDEILCRVEPITQQHREEIILDELLRKENSCNHMLEAAVTQQSAQKKEVLGGHTHHPEQGHSAPAAKLTAREKEILRMIADGLSSKMIAGQCRISINTVETHRRHLLEKLGVRNSMELVKEASKAFVL